MADVFNFYVRDNRKINFEIAEPIMREDSGVTDFRFHIPKTINGLDMSDWAWWFVFINANKEKYSIALTLSDDPESPLENNLATYTVDYAMSIKAGSVQFALEAINAGTGGAIDNEWHTLTYETKVKETLQGNQAEYAETESDIISALLEEVRTKVNQLVGGATPLPVSAVSAMTDTSKLYLLTTDGEWYYYNGSAWVSGGVYGAGVVDSAPTQGSANAVSSGGVYSALEDKADKDDTPETVTPTETDADLYICDSDGNVLAKFERGNIATQNFNSEDVPEVRDTSVQSGAFDLVDMSGNVVVRFENGHIKTKKFNSENVGSAISSIGVKGEKALSLHNAFSSCYIYHHMGVENTNPYIPSESIYDVHYAASLGFDMIEANTHKCSDGVFLVKHGANSGGLGNGLKDAIGSADYSSVKWGEVTSTWIRENVRYNARLPKFCGYIPTLDEFCQECRRFNMKVKVSSLEAAMVARKYLPDEMIWATLLNPSEGRGDFRGTVEYVWYKNANIDNAINVCKTVGAPLNIVVSGLLSNREDSELSEMIEKAHNNGFTVGIVYPTPNDVMRAINLGIDCAGSTNRTVNLFRNGNAKHIVNLSDTSIILSSGATYNSVTDTISMIANSSLHCEGSFASGIGSLVIRYSGKLTITVGATGTDYELIDYQSNGESYVMLSNVLAHRLDGSNWTKWFNISASTDTVIYELTFDGNYIS